MWLPKDERTLLAFCCTKISRGEAPFNLTHQELIRELKGKRVEADKQSIHETLFKLQNRNLIRWGSCADGNSVGITLSQQGHDLGQKYNSWWSRSNLWYAEHVKNHWIWLFVCFIGGVLIAQLINWLWAYLLKTPGAK